MKKKVGYISLLLAFFLVGCGSVETRREPTDIEVEVQEQAKAEEIETEQPKEEEDIEEFTFADVENLDFYFASGAGGWHTIMQIEADGSFSGSYADNDMGDTSEEYPNGVCYCCGFSGEFQKPKKIDANTYSTEIRTLVLEDEPGTEEIIDGILYRYTTPYGLDGAEEFLIYLIGSEVSALPEAYMDWVRNDMQDPDAEVLPFYGFYNVKAQNGFSSYDTYGYLASYIETTRAHAEEIRESLENDTMSQGDMNVMAQELYETWDCALNRMWNELKNELSEEEFQALLEEQRAWIKKKEAEVQAAGKEVEGGSLYPLITYMVAADLTEERTYELYEWLK